MPQILNLVSVRAFHAVARRLSFSRAAEDLGVSQPYISMQISTLEARLGTPLFDRVGRRVHLTEAGRMLERYAAPILAQLAEAERALADLRGLVHGQLSIAASTTPGAYVLPRLLALFRADHPGVEVSLGIGNAQDVERALVEERAELGIMAGEPTTSRLDAEQLGQDELALVVGPRHRLADRRVVQPVDLVDEPFVLHERSSNTRALLDAELRRVNVRPLQTMELSSIEAIKEAVAEHLGLSVLSYRAVRHELSGGRLRGLRVQGLDLVRPLCLATLRGKRLGPAAEAMRTLLLSQASVHSRPTRPRQDGGGITGTPSAQEDPLPLRGGEGARGWGRSRAR